MPPIFLLYKEVINMPSKYILERTADTVTKTASLERVHQLISEAHRLNEEATLLDVELKNIQSLQQSIQQHRTQLRRAYKENPDQAFEELNSQKETITAKKQMESVFSRMHRWGLRSYQVITQLRNTITGQDIVYHVQDAQHTVSYTLNEEQFLKLVSSNSIGKGRLSWAQVEQAIQGGAPPLDLFTLQVGATSEKKIQERTGVATSTIQLTKDALYQYLIQNRAIINEKTGNIDYARIAELHSQLLAKYKWQKDSSENVAFPKNNKSKYFFSQERQKLVDTFIRLYKKEKLHRDTDEFYKSGDATLDENTLIENKVGDRAVISLRTIRSAIRDIAALKGVNREALKQGLIKLFTSAPQTGKYLTQMLQEGAYKKAVESINKLFTS